MHTHHAQQIPGDSPTLKDPVCGMTVTAQSKHSHQHAGQSYQVGGRSARGAITAGHCAAWVEARIWRCLVVVADAVKNRGSGAGVVS